MPTDDLQLQQQNHISTVNRFFVPVIWLLFVFSLALAPWHDTWGAALLVGLPTALIPTILIVTYPYAVLTRLLVGVSMMVFCALNIHQSYAMTEMHFGVFVLLAFLVFYQDWRVIVLGAVVVALHHLLFNRLQELGYGTMCLAVPGIKIVLVHAVYVQSTGLNRIGPQHGF